MTPHRRTGASRYCQAVIGRRFATTRFRGPVRAEVDESQLIDVPAAAGKLIVFDGLLVHGSGSNRTDRPRRVANLVAIVPTADGTFRKFDDTLNPYLRGAPA